MWTLRMNACGYTAEDKAEIKKLRKMLLPLVCVMSGLSPLVSVRAPHGGGVVSVVLALVEGATFTAVLVLSWMIALRSGDEYRRVLLSKSLVLGTAVTMGLVCIWGWLEMSIVELPRVPLLMLPVVLCIATALAKIVVFRRETGRAL